jgi:hypothetical protein
MLHLYLAAFALGLTVAYTELMGRYRDAPLAVLRHPLCFVYALVNAGVSVLALYCIDVAAVFSDPWTGWVAVQAVLLAGLSGLAFLRSSIFTVRVGGSDIAVGPAAAIQVLQKAVDMTYDRNCAQRRMALVAQIMQGVSYLLAAEALPTACFNALQNASSEDKQQIAAEIKELTASTADNNAKALALGLILLDVFGADLLRGAVASLGSSLHQPETLSSSAAEALITAADSPEAAALLRAICAQMAPSVDLAAVDAATQSLNAPPLADAPPQLRLQLLTEALLGLYGAATVNPALGMVADNMASAAVTPKIG